MENIYVKLYPEEAVDSKRNLLSAEINFLNIIKKIQAYKKLRVNELVKRNAMKKKLKLLSSEIKSLATLLPSTKMPDIEHKCKPEKERKIEDELKEIREKLASLG